MVVSCQRCVVCLFICIIFLVIPSKGFSETRELSDAQLDQVVASNLPESISQILSNPLSEGEILEDLLPLISSIFNPELWSSSGLVHIHAVDSDVSAQTNMVFIQGASAADINLSNVYTSP